MTDEIVEFSAVADSRYRGRGARQRHRDKDWCAVEAVYDRLRVGSAVIDSRYRWAAGFVRDAATKIGAL